MAGLAKLNKYGAGLNSHDLVKFTALVIMTVDHIGFFFFPEEMWWRAIGRITFPVWFFLVGYSRGKQIPKDLAALAAVMILADSVMLYPIFPLNALVSIMACRLLVVWMEKRGRIHGNLFAIYLGCLVWLIPLDFVFEYGAQAILYAFGGYLVRHRPGERDTYLFMTGALAAFLAMQLFMFPFDIVQTVWVVCGTAVVTYYLSHFDLKHYELPDRWHIPAMAVRFVSRYSLYYYLLHYVGFQTVAWLLHPEQHTVFQWIDLG